VTIHSVSLLTHSSKMMTLIASHADRASVGEIAGYLELQTHRAATDK
jgi:hypothetical protein